MITSSKSERILKLMRRGYRLVYVSNLYVKGYRLISSSCTEGLDDIDIFNISDKIKQIKPDDSDLSLFAQYQKYEIRAEWILKD